MKNDKRNSKTGNFFAVVALVLSVLILFGFAAPNAGIFWLIALFNLICGPICLVLYLIEVRKGVFDNVED